MARDPDLERIREEDRRRRGGQSPTRPGDDGLHGVPPVAPLPHRPPSPTRTPLSSMSNYPGAPSPVGHGIGNPSPVSILKTVIIAAAIIIVAVLSFQSHQQRVAQEKAF